MLQQATSPVEAKRELLGRRFLIRLTPVRQMFDRVQDVDFADPVTKR